MGIWGPNLYQNDTSDKVKYEYQLLLRQGKTDEEAYRIMIQEYTNIPEEEKGDFWFALADIMWQLGRLNEEVKKQSLLFIEGEHRDWSNEEEQHIRVQVLEELKKQLKRPMPNRKDIKVHRPYRTSWKPGDIYAYQMNQPPMGRKQYKGWYVTVYVNNIASVDDVVPGVMDQLPEVYLELTQDIPDRNEQIRHQAKYMIMDTTDSELRKQFQYIGNTDQMISSDEKTTKHSCTMNNIEITAILEHERNLV